MIANDNKTISENINFFSLLQLLVAAVNNFCFLHPSSNFEDREII